MAIKLPFGMKDNKIYHISEVGSGLKCECKCPACGSKLIARKGNINAHCFAHYKSPECKYALETALHYYAKKILEEKKMMMIPALIYEEFDYYSHDNYNINKVELAKEQEIHFDKVVLEKQIDNIKPDVVAMVGNTKLMIEIVVTHGIDDIKLEKIKKLGIS